MTAIRVVRSRLVLAALAFSLHTHAADVEIKVVDSNGLPVVGAAVLMHTPASAAARELEIAPRVIKQERLRFVPALSVVNVGTAVTFTNEDPFDHHVRGRSERQSFEFLVPAQDDGAAPSKPRKVRAPSFIATEPDLITLSCHMHGSMAGHILVTDASHHGVTDAEGRVVLTAVPAAAVSVRVWHPRLLRAEPATNLTIADRLMSVRLKLGASLQAASRR